MAGMAGLGRVFDVVPIAAGVYISMKNASAVSFVCTGADTFTVREAKDASGTSVQNIGAVITFYYQNTSTAGAAGWTRQTQSAAASVVQGSAYTTVISIYASQMDDGFPYIRCNAASSGLVEAFLHDLTVQRKPANLATLSA
jgi:hypothetical protein